MELVSNLKTNEAAGELEENSMLKQGKTVTTPDTPLYFLQGPASRNEDFIDVYIWISGLKLKLRFDDIAS